LVDAEAEEVQLPSLEGLIGILPGHQPLMVGLGQGTLSYRKGSGGESFEVRGGQAHILPDKVLVFTELSPDEPEPGPQG
ncbi:MAG: F0F1 ATP synthase subunit epsilon, partial [Candidatus Aminicenantes bacterium]|nr:F0F1 ATP synthase subunit epsilon [Candidatus Aminicenantes bacterium]